MNNQSPGKIQILHLEDNQNDRELVQRVLKRSAINYEIEYANSRKELVAALNKGAFDLVLGDYTLPGFDGISALKLVHERDPELPFIFVTGSMGEETAIETMKVGGADYILKGNLARLPSALERVLKESASRKQQKAAEGQIKRQAKFLDQANDAIVVCDLKNRIIYWNKGAERVYGWSATEALGRDIAEFLANENRARWEDARKQIFEKSEWSGELLYAAKDGKIVITESHWTLVPDEGCHPPCILSINEDITERKQLEAQYLRAQRMESIGILAGGIAHDLNNILSPILMVSHLLRTYVNSPEPLELLDTVETSAKQGANLIKQILSFARGVEGERIEVQLGHLIRELQKLLRETLPRSIQIQTSVAEDLWTISGVPTQLNQVLMNLCVNARDAMPQGGKLTIKARNVMIDEAYPLTHPEVKIGAYVVICADDTGTGIPPEILSCIYEPFFTTKQVGQGTGLGLSTVKNIVKSHGGFVHVYSEMGKGTSFRAYFPALATASDERIEGKKLKVPEGRGEGILVVDDEAPVLQTTRKILERHGYEVFTATDGADGVAVFVKERSRIQVVLTDLMMPIMDGIAMIQTLQRISATVKVIVLSGLPENHKVSEIAEVEKIIIIQKPYSVEELLTSIRDVLDGTQHKATK